MVESSGDSIAPSAVVGVRLIGELLSEIRCVVLFKAGERKSRWRRPKYFVGSIEDCARCRTSWPERALVSTGPYEHDE